MALNYKNIIDINLAQGTSRAQYYTEEDLTLMNPLSGYLQNPVFGESSFDRVELHVYDTDNNHLFSDHRITDWSVDTDKELKPQIQLSLNNNITAAGYDSGVFNIVYNFHRDAVGKPVGPKFKIHAISPSRTEIRIIPTFQEDDDLNQGAELEEFYSRLDRLFRTSGTNNNQGNFAAIPNNPLWTQLQLNLGHNRIFTIAAWVINDIFPPDPDVPNSMLIKLYEPLPTEFKPKQQGWVVAEATQPIIEKVILDKSFSITGNSIAGPNFDLCLDTAPRVQTGYKSYNNILGGDSDIKTELQNNMSSSLDGVSLNIDYSVLENYVHFSSAEQRVENFIYKLRQIHQFDEAVRKYNYSEYSTSDVYVYEYTGSHGSTYVKQYQKRWVDKKVKLINEFDSFEKWLYFESGSNSHFKTTTGSRGGGIHDWSRSAITPFPKLSGSFKNDLWTEDYHNWSLDQLFDWAVHSIFIPGPNYELLHVTHSKSTDWKTTTIASASAYDKQNNNILRKTVPEFISDTGKDSNETYIRFLDMVGQAHDVQWTYARHLTDTSNRFHNQNYDNRTGISDDLIYHVGKNYGMDLLDGDPNQNLWYYKLGKNDSGIRLQNNPTSSIKTLTANQRKSEVWRRIVNNLPFLLKAKGTPAGVRGLINCYGIPEDILPVYEYGSSKKSRQKTLHKEQRFNYCLNFNSSQSIATSWGPHQGTVGTVTSSAVTPNAVEFRIWPSPSIGNGVSTAGQYSQSLWQVNDKVGIVLHRSHSVDKNRLGKQIGITQDGYFSLVISGSDQYISASTPIVRAFESTNEKEDGSGWWTVLLNRKNTQSTPHRAYGAYHSSSKYEYELTAVRAGYGTIDQAVSCSIKVTGSRSYFSASLNSSWSGSLESSVKAYFGGYVTQSTSKYIGQHGHGKTFSGRHFGHPFNGSMQELRYYANPISLDTLRDHALAPELYASNNGTETFNELLLRLNLTQKANHYSASRGLPETGSSVNIISKHPDQRSSRTFWDKSNLFPLTGSATNYADKEDYGYSDETYYINTPELGPNNYTSNKIRRQENKLMRHLSSEARAEAPASEKFALDSNNLGIYFSPTDQTNKDIFEHIGGQQLDNFIGDAQESFEDKYHELQRLNRIYWKKYSKGTDRMAYLNELKLYDMSLFTMLKKSLPARANADLGVVIQPHFLERSKTPGRGKITVTGDTKNQNIATTPKSLVKFKQPTSIAKSQPQVNNIGFTVQPQTITAKIGKPNKPATKVTVQPTTGVNSVVKSFTVTPQQFVAKLSPSVQQQAPATTTIDGIVSNANSPMFVLANETAKTVGKGLEKIEQFNASTVVSHDNSNEGSIHSQITGKLVATKQVQAASYAQTSLYKQSDGTYIKVKTPGWKQSGSMLHVCDYRPSEFRKTAKYFYSSSLSASLGKSYEDGGSVNPYAYSQSLKQAEVSDFNLGGTLGSNRARYIGTQLAGIDFNVNSSDTPDGGPVVSFTLGDPNKIISSDPGFGGNLSIK